MLSPVAWFISIFPRKGTRSMGLEVVAGNFAVLDKKPHVAKSFAQTGKSKSINIKKR
jgi:hypothetical protein